MDASPASPDDRRRDVTDPSGADPAAGAARSGPLADLAPEDLQATFTATLVDEWVRGGVRHAVVCPGSRSTPLALAVAQHPGLQVHVHHDERSGGFLAVGLGRATGRPPLVVTTSGTATVELHPAVVEAHHAGVPLLVCTADRPPELQDVGAPQTIDQANLYGPAVRWFADPGVAGAAAAPTWRALASRALAEALGSPPGPVQLNLPFREPLVGVPGTLPPGRAAATGGSAGDAGDGGDGVRPAWTGTVGPAGIAGRDVAALAARLRGRGLVVAGEGSGTEAADLAQRLEWPLAADPRSPVWDGRAEQVEHLDAVLRSAAARTRLRPEVVLRLGEPPASRLVNEWCAGSGADQVVVSALHWTDPAATAGLMVRADPVAVARQLLDLLGPRTGGPEAGASGAPGSDLSDGAAPAGEWLAAWQAAGSAAAAALPAAAGPLPRPNEPLVARDVVAGVPAGGSLVVASSMPIRDVERYAAARPGLAVVANRGANGIDGVVSTAVGVALGSGRPTGLLLGDLAFLHDSNGLLGLAGEGRRIDLVVVVVDNDGGGIFSFLPQSGQLPADRFERLFGTPHGLDLVALAQGYGVEARRVAVTGPGDLAGHLAAAFARGGVQVLVVPTDRAANVEVHRTLDHAMAAAVDRALPG